MVFTDTHTSTLAYLCNGLVTWVGFTVLSRINEIGSLSAYRLRQERLRQTTSLQKYNKLFYLYHFIFSPYVTKAHSLFNLTSSLFPGTKHALSNIATGSFSRKQQVIQTWFELAPAKQS